MLHDLFKKAIIRDIKYFPLDFVLRLRISGLFHYYSSVYQCVYLAEMVGSAFCIYANVYTVSRVCAMTARLQILW